MSTLAAPYNNTLGPLAYYSKSTPVGSGAGPAGAGTNLPPLFRTCEQRCIALDDARGNQVLLPGQGSGPVTAAQRLVESDLKRALDRCAFEPASAGCSVTPRHMARIGSVNALSGLLTPNGSEAGAGSARASLSASPSASAITPPPIVLPRVSAAPSVASVPSAVLQRQPAHVSAAHAGAAAAAPTPAAATTLRSGNGKRTRSPVEQRRRYVCKICVKGFTTSGHLARHNRIHTGEKNHVCPHEGCGQRFSRHDNCVQHYKTHLRRNTWHEDSA